MKDRILFLHVGHDKTGSTALQAAFTASRDVLRDHGIDYPATGDDAKVIDLNNMVPVGNARYLSKSPQALRKELAALPDGTRHTLFSSELIFELLTKQPDLSFIDEAARTAGYSEVRVLLFIRDPVPHAVSVWQQRVKGWQGETAPLDAWLAETYATPEQVLDVVRKIGTRSDLRLTVYHYDRRKHRLLEEAEAWLGLPEGTLLRPAHTVNRSLTASEAALQRALNAKLGPSGKVFGFRLVNQLPDLPREPPTPSAPAQRRALERLRPALDAVNALLPDGEHYRTDPVPAAREEARSYRFSEAQLEIIAEGIADMIGRPPETTAASTWRRFPRRVLRFIKRRWLRLM